MILKSPFILTLTLISTNSYAIDIVTGQQSLEFHGYFRSGLGLSESGTTQAKFQAPGTRASYRLGNEPDTNLELQLNYKYNLEQPQYKESYVQGVFMLDGYKTQGESNDLTIDHLAQGYLSFNKFFDNDSTLWIGRRYYDRKDIHIMDHTWLNPGQGSHSGFGIEDVSAGSGKLKFALFRYEDNFTITNTPYLINSTNIDLRWYDLTITDHSKLTLWAGFTTRHELASLNYDNESGYGIGSWIDYKVKNIKNTTALLYQIGPAITQGDYNARPIREDLGWDLGNATSLEISNTLTYELLPKYSIQWALLYRQEDHGVTGGSEFDWVSTGVRPIIYFSKHINLAFEVSIDHIDDKINNRSGSLSKLTTALQVAANRGFKSRPVMRFFVTFADWSDELQGLVGNTPADAPYADSTQGWTLGAQVEVWW